MWPLLAVNLSSKVLVAGDQISVIGKRHANDVIVRQATRRIKYGKYVVALLPEPTRNGGAGILINKKAHQRMTGFPTITCGSRTTRLRCC